MMIWDERLRPCRWIVLPEWFGAWSEGVMDVVFGVYLEVTG